MSRKRDTVKRSIKWRGWSRDGRTETVTVGGTVLYTRFARYTLRTVRDAREARWKKSPLSKRVSSTLCTADRTEVGTRLGEDHFSWNAFRAGTERIVWTDCTSVFQIYILSWRFDAGHLCESNAHWPQKNSSILELYWNRRQLARSPDRILSIETQSVLIYFRQREQVVLSTKTNARDHVRSLVFLYTRLIHLTYSTRMTN